MIILASILANLAFAETMDVFVSPIKFTNKVTNHEITVSHENEAPFYYTSIYAGAAKYNNGRGGYSAIHTILDDIRVYNEETISFVYNGCDYVSTPLFCSVTNGHYYVATEVTFNDSQMIIRSTLYDKDATVINTSSRTDEMVINWIKQQEVTVVERQGRMGKETLTHYGKEELPLKWEIPYELLQTHVRQTISGLWMGIKIDP
jgi:hypothetical protein|tara:strand:- start:1531 stop:2142 length:612 start_codon:yes stop_codon:yes gene_type:complete